MAAVVVNKRASCGHDRRGCCVSPAPPLLVLCALFSFLAARVCGCFFFRMSFFLFSLSLSHANRAGVFGGRKALFRFVLFFRYDADDASSIFARPGRFAHYGQFTHPKRRACPLTYLALFAAVAGGYSVGLAIQEPGRHTSALIAVLATQAYDSSA